MMEHTAKYGAALADELRNVLSQAEELLHAIGDDSDAALGALRERVHASIETARARLTDLESEADHVSERAVVAAESWVRENPWTTLAICLGFGVAIGTVLGNGRPRQQERANP